MQINTLIPIDNNTVPFCSGVDSTGQAQAIAVDESGHILTSQSSGSALYDVAGFVIPPLTADYDVAINETDLFDDVPTAGFVEIVTSNTIFVRFNDIWAKAYTITSSQSPAQFRIKCTNIFIDSTLWATVQIFLQP